MVNDTEQTFYSKEKRINFKGRIQIVFFFRMPDLVFFMVESGFAALPEKVGMRAVKRKEFTWGKMLRIKTDISRFQTRRGKL